MCVDLPLESGYHGTPVYKVHQAATLLQSLLKLLQSLLLGVYPLLNIHSINCSVDSIWGGGGGGIYLTIPIVLFCGQIFYLCRKF